MHKKSGIEWTGRSDWNPIRGCTRVSEGCRNCYAETIAGRFSAPGSPFHGFATQTDDGGRWTGKVELIKERLALPLKWRKPATIFVNSAFDLFHEAIPDEVIDQVFAVMALAPQHTFQVLTKRAERMREYMAEPERAHIVARSLLKMWVVDNAIPNPKRTITDETLRLDMDQPDDHAMIKPWPLPNVWLGVSVEDQRRADERIPYLLAAPAAVRWVSAEPLLALVYFTRVQIIPPTYRRSGVHLNALTGRCVESGLPYHSQWDGEGSLPLEPGPHLDWVVVGGESGPGARPMHPDWARSIRDQCASANVPFFFKQWGNWSPCTLEPDEEGNPMAAYPMVGCVAAGVHTGDQEALFWNGSDWVQWGYLSKLPAIGVRNVGKARAGRLLDGVEHSEFPEVRS